MFLFLLGKKEIQLWLIFPIQPRGLNVQENIIFKKLKKNKKNNGSVVLSLLILLRWRQGTSLGAFSLYLALFLCFTVVKVKVTQSCLTLRDHMGFRLSGSSVHRILQARILEWAGIPFSRGSS